VCCTDATGVPLQTTDIAGKRLELLRELVPGVRRLAFMANVAGPNARLEMDEVRAAARKLNIDIVALEIQSGEDIAPAFEALKSRAEALYVALDPVMNAHRVRINTLALGARLPTLLPFGAFVEAGGLMSYAPNQRTCSGASPTTSTRFCAGRSRPTFRSSSLPSLISSSTSRPPKRRTGSAVPAEGAGIAQGPIAAGHRHMA
jgi:hypothetical protein